jgi:hypothetical protein
MPNISYDAQSFSVDGRRVWLVSGSVHYARVPRALWRDRLRAAKQAGLNCIDTYVFWNLHEPAPGQFDFEGERDLRRFIEIIAEEGLFCILRPGPFIDSAWDFAGLPAWLTQQPDIALRQSNRAFLEATARYLGAVMAQVRDLQVSEPVHGRIERPGAGNPPGAPAGGFAQRSSGAGPILMMQAEHQWLSHNPDEEEAYLRQVARYLRENGATVPITNCNMLHQPVEGTLNTWNAAGHLATDLRQLAVVQPDAPRFVSEYWTGGVDTWGADHQTVDAALHEYRMAEMLASGAQFNLSPFHGGTNFAFHGGRTVDGEGGYATTSFDGDAPLHEAGGRGTKYHATKRLATFASQFHHVFANLHTAAPHAAVAPSETKHPLSVVHRTGDQSDVVFIFKSAEDKTDRIDLMLPDGQTLPVPIGSDRVAWLLLQANLGAVRLNYTNLRPWAFIEKRMLVLFGPAGSDGLVALDDVQYHIKVPTGKTPTVEQHEGLTLVVLSREQVDAAYLGKQGLIVGADGLDEADQPRPLRGWGQMHQIGLDATHEKQNVTQPRKPSAPRLSQWQHAPLDALVDGSDERYTKIDGPKSLEALEANFGYGWYQVSLGKSRQGRMLMPAGGDRLHLYQKGKLKTVLGEGPGATPMPTSLTLGGELVALADNLGRRSNGYGLGEVKGLAEHIYTVEPIKLNAPKRIAERAADPFTLSGYVPGHRKGEQPPSESLAWTFKPANRKPVILEIADLPVDVTVLINDTPVAFYAAHEAGPWRCLLDPKNDEATTGGQNRLKLSPMQAIDRQVNVTKYVTLHQTKEAITAKTQWHFAPWRMPGDDAFGDLPNKAADQPAWFRSMFHVKQTSMPLFVEPRGMSKGQIYLNGYNVGRYFIATRDGKAVSPQKQYYLPESWLRTDEANVLMLFDEHGNTPGNVRLAYNAMGPFGK